MMLAQTTQPTGWHDPNVVFGALGALIAALWLAYNTYKSQRADTKADANARAISDTRADVRSTNEQITSVAAAMPGTPGPQGAKGDTGATGASGTEGPPRVQT